jgi:hypothetical protein
VIARHGQQADPQLHAVSYAFDLAFQRICEATNDDALMAELSNALHHLFRLGELCKDRIGKPTFYAADHSTPELRQARGACWARNFDTHQLFAPAALEDVYPEFYMARYGAVVWVPLPSLPMTTDVLALSARRHMDYAQFLDGQELLGTLRRGFDALTSLL